MIVEILHQCEAPGRCKALDLEKHSWTLLHSGRSEDGSVAILVLRRGGDGKVDGTNAEERRLVTVGALAMVSEVTDAERDFHAPQ